MAVLNKIRQRSVFLILIIALALFSFVLADVIRNGGMSSQKSQNVIATVNGEDVEREEFAREVEAVQRNMGPNSTTAAVVDQVWDRTLREVILKEEFEKLGIGVGEAQVRELLKQQLAGNPNFVNEAGFFNDNRLEEYVANLKATSPGAYQQWVAFEDNVAESARGNIYYSLIKAGVGATELEGEQAYRFANDNVDLQYVQIPYSTVPDSEVQVSKEEINEYVKNHSKRFKVTKGRDLQYVFFPETASPEDEAESKGAVEEVLSGKVEYNSSSGQTDSLSGFQNAENIETFVNRNSDIQYQDRFVFRNELQGTNAERIFNLQEGEVFGPYKEEGFWKVSKLVGAKQIADSAKAKHIMVAWAGLPTGSDATRTKEEAKALADSLGAVIRNDSAKFAELASQFSSDVATKEAGGDLGYFGPGMMVSEFNDFVFDNAAGATGVVETDFGYHVINIDEKSDPERAVKVATIAREIVPSEESLNDLYTEVTRFEMEAKEKGFVEAAREETLEVKTVKDLKPLDENIPGVGNQRIIVQWAFEEGVENGDIKRFEVPGGYVIAQVTAVKKDGLMSAENASATVSPILIKKKKAEIIKERISGNDLSQIAGSFNVQVQTAGALNFQNPTIAGAGREPEVVGAAFSLEPGEVSKPIAGENGVYVVKVEAINKAPDMASYRSFASQETAQRKEAVATRVFEALKDNAEIEDNRSNFY